MNVRSAEVIVARHTEEQVLTYNVAEAEAVYGRPLDDELDRNIQTGMFAVSRIALGDTWHKVASAVSYVLDGKSIRTAKIRHSKEIETTSIIDVRRESWGCVSGIPPTSHCVLT